MKTIAQEIELVENLGGFVTEDNKIALFRFNESVSNDNCESITLKEAIDVEKQMMDAGYDGALIGHPLDESDDHCIYFEIH